METTDGGRRLAIERSSTGLAVSLRRGVVGARAHIGDPGAGIGRRRDHDYHALVLRLTERLPQVGGSDPPCVRREINERVDQRPVGALRHEIADEAVRVHAVGGTKIDNAEHGLASHLRRGGHHGRVDHLERGALREGMPRVVVRHTQKLGTSFRFCRRWTIHTCSRCSTWPSSQNHTDREKS